MVALFWNERRRHRRVGHALPGALDEIARSLRAGASLVQAIDDAARTTPGAIGDDLFAVVAAHRSGVPLADALARWRSTRPLPGVRLTASALELGLAAGGTHARAVDGVAATFRDNLAISAEVRAQAAQAQASALVIGLAPIGFTALACLADHRTASFLFQTPAGLACLAVGGTLDAAGAMWMRAHHPHRRMSAWALGCAWAALVVAAAWASRPAPRRVSRARPSQSAAGETAPTFAPAGDRASDQIAARPPATIRLPTRGWAGRCSPQCSSCRSSRCSRLPAGAATWAFGAWRGRQRRRAEADLVRRGLPEVVDLFVVGIGAGLNVPLALRSIGPLCPTPFADALRSTVTQTEMGMRTADALEALPQRLGEPVRPLSSALIASERYGVPLTASLERLADEVRRDRRRHAEAAARRVPVKLLFPLVFCSLPALALLSVAPLIAGALRALRT